MITSLKRRLLDTLGEAPSFITEDSRVTGDVETTGSLVVCGTIRGDGQIGGALQMTVSAQWFGEVHARSAVIAGQLTGKLVIEEKVEIGASAVIRADVESERIASARGAVVDGTRTVSSGEPGMHCAEKRKER
jgi:cytoskeletal protein CcmA (bactofilin family)